MNRNCTCRFPKAEQHCPIPRRMGLTTGMFNTLMLWPGDEDIQPVIGRHGRLGSQPSAVPRTLVPLLERDGYAERVKNNQWLIKITRKGREMQRAINALEHGV